MTELRECKEREEAGRNGETLEFRQLEVYMYSWVQTRLCNLTFVAFSVKVIGSIINRRDLVRPNGII